MCDYKILDKENNIIEFETDYVLYQFILNNCDTNKPIDSKYTKGILLKVVGI